MPCVLGFKITKLNATLADFPPSVLEETYMGTQYANVLHWDKEAGVFDNPSLYGKPGICTHPSDAAAKINIQAALASWKRAPPSLRIPDHVIAAVGDPDTVDPSLPNYVIKTVRAHNADGTASHPVEEMPDPSAEFHPDPNTQVDERSATPSPPDDRTAAVAAMEDGGCFTYYGMAKVFTVFANYYSEGNAFAESDHAKEFLERAKEYSTSLDRTGKNAEVTAYKKALLADAVLGLRAATAAHEKVTAKHVEAIAELGPGKAMQAARHYQELGNMTDDLDRTRTKHLDALYRVLLEFQDLDLQHGVHDTVRHRGAWELHSGTSNKRKNNKKTSEDSSREACSTSPSTTALAGKRAKRTRSRSQKRDADDIAEGTGSADLMNNSSEDSEHD